MTIRDIANWFLDLQWWQAILFYIALAMFVGFVAGLCAAIAADIRKATR